MNLAPLRILLAISWFSGCAGRPSADAPPRREPKPEPAVAVAEAELGTIDEGAVTKVLGALQTPIAKCHLAGRARVPALWGEVGLVLRIDGRGHVRYAHVSEASTLGDRDTERCILALLIQATWPTPKDGEAEIRRSLPFAPGNEAPPLEWGPAKVLDSLAAANTVKAELEKCKVSGDLSLTGYVSSRDAGKKASKPAASDFSARFVSIGVGAKTHAGAMKADCVVEALKLLALPNPGPSQVAKVSFVL